MRNRIYASAAAVLALGFTGLMAGTANAAPANPVVYNSNAEAGYYIQSHNQIHYRDVRATFPTTQAQLAISTGGSLTGNGGIGLQLCNNSTGYALQFGLIPDPANDPSNPAAGKFDLAYQTGTLNQVNPSSTHDACATGGTLPFPVTITTLASYNTIPVGDTVNLEIFYNHVTGFAHLLVTDAAQGGQESFSVWIGNHAFSEPGVGVRALNATGVSAPADIDFADFSGIRVTQVNGVHYAFTGSQVVADNYNKGGSATDAAADLLQVTGLANSGHDFSVDIGNPTA